MDRESTTLRFRGFPRMPSSLLFGPVCLVVLLLCTSVAAQTATQEELAKQAETYAHKAFEAYHEKDYVNAVTLYRKAYDLLPTSMILFNIARIYETGLRDRLLAMEFYRRYIADPGAEPDRIRTANTRIIALRQAEQAAEFEQSRQAAAATASTPVAAAPQASQSFLSPAAPPAEEDGWGALQIAGLSTALVGVASIAVGSFYGLAARSDRNDARPLCPDGPCRTPEGLELSESALRNATISTITLSTGGALVVAGIVLWILDPTGAEGAAPNAQQSANLRWSPSFDESMVGAHMRGSW